MAQPNDLSITKRPELLTFEEFDQIANRKGYICNIVAPVIEVGKSEGKIGRIRREDLLKIVDTARAPGAAYPERDMRFTYDSYDTEDRGLSEAVDDNNRAVWGDYLMADRQAVLNVVDGILGAQERRIAALFAGAGFDSDPGTDWSDYSASTPIEDVISAMQDVADVIGMKPNAVVLSWKKAQQAWLSEQVAERLGLSGSADMNMRAVSAAALAAAFDIERVIIHSGYQNVAAEGATASLNLIWPDDVAYVCRIATTSDPAEVCVARQYHWAGDGSTVMGTVESWREELRRRDMFRVRHQMGEAIRYVEACKAITGLNG